MIETIAIGGVKREVFDLLFGPVKDIYNSRGYYGFSQRFPNSASYERMIAPVLKSRYQSLSDEDIVSVSNTFFVFIGDYLRSYVLRSRFLCIDEFTESEIFRSVMKNGVNGALNLLEKKVFGAD